MPPEPRGLPAEDCLSYEEFVRSSNLYAGRLLSLCLLGFNLAFWPTDLLVLRGQPETLRTFALERLAVTVVTGGFDGVIRLWDTETGKQIRCLKGRASVVAVSPDGNALATIGDGIRIWEVATGQQRSCWNGHKDSVTSLAFSPDGKDTLLGER